MKDKERKVVPVTVVESLDKEYNVERTEELKAFTTEPAYVTYKEGVTISLGNYESSRLDYGVTIPCEIADIEATTIEAITRVKGVLKERVTVIKGLV